MNEQSKVSVIIHKWYRRFEYLKRYRICSHELTKIRSKGAYDLFDWLYRNKRKEELNAKGRESVVWGEVTE